MARENEMEKFVVGRNIERFRRLLDAERDPEKRAILRQLLREERGKQIGFYTNFSERSAALI